jgi:branched-chain amino acid transport system ATP-binding protein
LSEQTILEIESVVKRFGGVPAVDRATLAVAAGSITALIGPNGAGKTSLFNVISGFQRADEGHVRFEGQRIDRLPVYRIARAGLVRTFQQTKILHRMSVLDNMLLAGSWQPGESLWRLPLPGESGRRERDLEQKARERLRAVRLDGQADAYAGTLSGGQRKLLEFARVLMTEPRMVLLDEPMAGVNPALREQLLEQMLTIRQEQGTTFLLIEHDLETVMTVSDTVAVMNAGRVIFRGAPAEVQRNEEVIDAYLGTEAGTVAEALP